MAVDGGGGGGLVLSAVFCLVAMLSQSTDSAVDDGQRQGKQGWGKWYSMFDAMQSS